MRTLFLESHPMWIYGLPNGFYDAGCQVKVSGPLTKENIPKMIADFTPDIIFTIGWTSETTGEKTEWIKKYVKASGIPHVYWATEDLPYSQAFSLNYIKETEPDFVFTVCPEAIENYRRQGIRAAYSDFGFHYSVHHSSVMEKEYQCDIAVVANAYPELTPVNHYRFTSMQNLINPIIQAKWSVDFWGNRWEDMTDCLGEIPAGWWHGILDYTLAYKVYNSAKIILGIQNHPSQLTQRVYEILASGGFLITNDTPAIRRSFVPSKDLVVTRSPQETLSLVHYYLDHSVEREKIRSQARVSVSEHSYCNRAVNMMNVLQDEGIISMQEPLKKLPSKLITCGSPGKKEIALTYDVGGELPLGEKVLDVLKAHGVKCTFFLTGAWVEKFPDLAKRIASDGHELGNHTVDHPDLTQLSSDEILMQINACDQMLTKCIGRSATRLFRPPYGYYDDRVLQMIGVAGFKYTIFWSVDTLDWKQISDAEILERIINNAENGGIVLMHMAADNTADATNQAIPLLQGKGFRLVTVSELLETGQST